MSCSKLRMSHDSDELRKKKDERNRKKREKFAALSLEEKENRRQRNREAYQRRKFEKFLHKPLRQQSEQVFKSPVVAPIIRSICDEKLFHDKVNQVTQRQRFKQATHDAQSTTSKEGQSSSFLFLKHFQLKLFATDSSITLIGIPNRGIQIIESMKNSSQVSYTEPAEKLKKQISSFSTYERGK